MFLSPPAKPVEIENKNKIPYEKKTSSIIKKQPCILDEQYPIDFSKEEEENMSTVQDSIDAVNEKSILSEYSDIGNIPRFTCLNTKYFLVLVLLSLYYSIQHSDTPL